jgi:DNA-binding LytR/AlgR family response regulator
MNRTVPLKVALADDEPLARRRLSRMLKARDCEVVAELASAEAVLTWFRAEPREIHALFLDIQMPGLTGLELVGELEVKVPVVFVTAYTQFAIQAFEAEALDYLLKPLAEARLDQTVARLRAGLVVTRSGPEVGGLLTQRALKVPVKAGDGTLLLDLKKISHFEVEDEVVYAHAAEQRLRTPWTALTEVEQAHPCEPFLRIQRHILLRLEAVLGLRDSWNRKGLVKVLGGAELEVTRAAFVSLKDHLGV